MKIIAIDPGPVKSAFILYDTETKEIEVKSILNNQDIIMKLGIFYKVDLCIIEMIASYGMPVGREIFETCIWIGRFIQEYRQYDTLVELVYRKDIKNYLCGSSKAKDSNIRQALINKYGQPGTKMDPNKFYNDSTNKMKKDIWSALAVLDYSLGTIVDRKV